jgi:hypothetical protein
MITFVLRTHPLPIDKTSRWLLKAQDGRCAICRDALVSDEDRPQNPRDWERWFATSGKTIIKLVIREDGKPDNNEPSDNTLTAATAAVRHFCPAYGPWGLLEPGARKRARPGSEGARNSNVLGLPVLCEHVWSAGLASARAGEPGAAPCLPRAEQVRGRQRHDARGQMEASTARGVRGRQTSARVLPRDR